MANSTKIAIVGLMILLVVVVAKYVKTGTPVNEASTEPIVSANESATAGSSGNVENEGSSILRNRMRRATQPLTERSFLVDSSGRGSFRQDARAGESFPGEPLKRTETTSEGYVDPDQPSPSEAAPETAVAEAGGGVQSPPESNTLLSKRDAESGGVQEEAAGEGGAQETVVPPPTRTVSANPPTPTGTRRTNSKVPGFPKKHTLKEGETYWDLAVKYYGKGWLHPEISKANKKKGSNPKKLRPGMVVLIPPPPPKAIKKVKKQIGTGPGPVKTGAGSVKPPASVAPKSPPPGYYVVKKNDTLSGIAERLLGSSRHMGKFYEVNKSLELEYTQLQVGTRLRVPKL